MRLPLSHPALAFLGYVVLIWATLPILPPVVSWVRGHAGSHPVALVAPLATLVLGAVLLRNFLRGSRPRHARWALPLAGAGAVAVLWVLRGNPVEQVHLLEYGLLGFLGLRAAREGAFPGRRRLPFWGAAVPVAGLADEIIQGFLPNRVFDWRDVAVNAVSGLLGMLVYLGIAADRFDPPDGAGV